VTARTLGLLAALLAVWVGLQGAWLAADDRITEGDVLGNVGAVELFWEDHEGRWAGGELVRAYVEDFGEYPALYPAITGVVARWAGVADLDGDGPARVALLWGVLTLLSTFWLGRTLGGSDRAGLFAAGALAVSPLWSALARHVMLENGVCALTALSAAAGFATVRRGTVEGPSEPGGSLGAARGGGLWLLCGAAAGLALLVKQTAVLVLLPLAGGLLVEARRQHQLRGAAVAGAMSLLVAGPWYVRRLLGDGEGDYLLRSLRANPDAVGALHQALFYPLVLLQQPWAPVVVAAAVVLGWGLWRRRDPAPLLIALAGVGLLALLPKKYPRLLLPLLPFVAAWLGAQLASWPSRRSGALAGFGVLCLALSSVAVTPLGVSQVGLRNVDERCYQDWFQPPSQPGLDFTALLTLLEEAGGAGTEYRVGSPRWPVPPCAHQTTHHLGEHLRIRVRRAGLEAYVMTGSWRADEAWPEGEPEVLVTDGPFACSDLPAACGSIRALQRMGRVVLDHPQWPVTVYVYRVR
jgi:hypothetical protein